MDSRVQAQGCINAYGHEFMITGYTASWQTLILHLPLSYISVWRLLEASHLETWIRGHDIVCQSPPARQTSRLGSQNSQRRTFMCSCNKSPPSRGNNRGAMNARRVYRISHFMGTRYKGWCMSGSDWLGKVKPRATQESCVPLGPPATEEWCVCMPPTRKMWT